MPQVKNPKADTAEVMYLRGESYKAISKELGIPESTLRRWQSKYRWSENLSKCSVSDKVRNANVFENLSQRSLLCEGVKTNVFENIGVNAGVNRRASKRRKPFENKGDMRCPYFVCGHCYNRSNYPEN